MTVFAGIDRAGLEGCVLDFLKIHSGVPADNIFIADFSSNEPAPPRPMVSFVIRPPTAEVGPAEFRPEPSLEYWRAEVTDASDGTYTLTIDGIDYSHVASGETVTQIRDALVALAAGAPNASVTATGTLTASIDIESDTTPGLRLDVSASPGTVTVARLRGDAVTVSSKTAELVIEILCTGLYDPENPTAEQNGEAIASRLEAAFENIQNTQAMRRKKFIPRRWRRSNSNQILDGEAYAVGGLDVIMAANRCAVADQANTLVTPVEAI
jgi:hypothetical protein